MLEKHSMTVTADSFGAALCNYIFSKKRTFLSKDYYITDRYRMYQILRLSDPGRNIVQKM